MNVRNIKTPVGLAALVAAAIGLTACEDKPDVTTEPTQSTPAAASTAPAPAPAPAPEAKPQVDANQKLNLYIQCFNATHERAHKAMERYASWVKDMKVGPTGKERVIYGVYSMSESSLKDCGEPLIKAAQSEPVMPALDTAAKDYSATVTTWGQTLQEADTYYSRENYKDDAMARGKAMHGDIVKHYAAFSTANRQFNQALEEANDERQLIQLAEIEKSEGRQFNYWYMATMLSAKQLVNLLTQDDFNVDTATSRLKAYEDNADALIELAKKPETAKPSTWLLMSSPLESYRISAKERLRRVRDKTPYSQSERMMLSSSSGWMVDGSAEKLIRNYNSLVESSNRMR
ncbi:YiiG family protein [Pectobacterium sp. B1J-3]|uniref:YiiG family protein n=1 Tax=Pectobacterium sp. B1J-3 TaxID=3385371 RepID=UPI0039060A4C